MAYRFQSEQWVAEDVGRVFCFFADPRNLPRIMPPSGGARLVRLELVLPRSSGPPSGAEPLPLAEVGSKIVVSFRLFPFLPLRRNWTARITEFELDRYFTDAQLQGPFRNWHHRHVFLGEQRQGRWGTLVRDVVEYEIGYGPLGALAQKLIVAPMLKKMFAARAEAVERILSRQDGDPGTRP